MNRRGFLGLLGAGAVVAASGLMLPDDELWVPGKSIFLPPAGGWLPSRGNTLWTVDRITNEALKVLHYNLSFAGSVNRQYDSLFSNAGATVRVGLPPKFANNYLS